MRLFVLESLQREPRIARIVDLVITARDTGDATVRSLVVVALRVPPADAPAGNVVVVSGASDAGTIVEALDLGAMGFIPKTSPRDVLLNAVRLVASGGVYVPVEALKARSQRDASPDGLLTALPKSAGAATPLRLG